MPKGEDVIRELRKKYDVTGGIIDEQFLRSFLAPVVDDPEIAQYFEEQVKAFNDSFGFGTPSFIDAVYKLGILVGMEYQQARQKEIDGLNGEI